MSKTSFWGFWTEPNETDGDDSLSILSSPLPESESFNESSILAITTLGVSRLADEFSISEKSSVGSLSNSELTVDVTAETASESEELKLESWDSSVVGERSSETSFWTSASTSRPRSGSWLWSASAITSGTSSFCIKASVVVSVSVTVVVLSSSWPSSASTSRLVSGSWLWSASAITSGTSSLCIKESVVVSVVAVVVVISAPIVVVGASTGSTKVMVS